MKILVLNAGSSSLKYALYETSPDAVASDSDQLLGEGLVERVTTMPEALKTAFADLTPLLRGEKITGVGHRVVHGATFPGSIVIDAGVEAAIDKLSELAPLHNPRSLAAYRAALAHVPDAIQPFTRHCPGMRMRTRFRPSISPGKRFAVTVSMAFRIGR